MKYKQKKIGKLQVLKVKKNSDYIQSLIKDDGFKIIETPKHGYRYRLQDLVDDNVNGLLNLEIENINFFTEK